MQATGQHAQQFAQFSDQRLALCWSTDILRPALRPKMLLWRKLPQDVGFPQSAEGKRGARATLWFGAGA
jgi:hypothetical protein